MVFFAVLLASFLFLLLPSYAHALMLPIEESPQDAFFRMMTAIIILFSCFSLVSALIESVFFYIFLGDFVKLFRRYFLSFFLANVAAIGVFLVLQFLVNGLWLLSPNPLTYSPPGFLLVLLPFLSYAAFILPFAMKYLVLRKDFNRLAKQGTVSKPISNRALFILFILGTAISLAINYFAVLPAISWLV